ncbi:MAG: hypothetical protein PHY73_05790 [Candidatus Omnitrophica bacterium]|nr:hypothetical protein [Candidatus Omnitrophota bacterium]
MIFFKKKFKNVLGEIILAIFFCLQVCPSPAYAQAIFNLPQPGAMVFLTPEFTPIIFQGLRVYPENPLEIDFIIDSGDERLDRQGLEVETQKLVQYFLASMTIPEKDIWVNLSPYEEDRIVEDSLRQTIIGRDLLAQDYLLKQITASLIYPEDELGRKFWDKVYKEAYKQYQTTEIPVNTFNKVWIVPEKAVVYETENGVVIGESHLKVMLEQDYLALHNNLNNNDIGIASRSQAETRTTNQVASQIVKEIVLPAIEKEVNEGKNFKQLRQIFHSLILATWFKKALKNSILANVYADQSKTKGIDLEDKSTVDKIYDLYLEAFKKGVYDFVKVEQDPLTKRNIARKYFSGGFLSSESDQWMERRDASYASSNMIQSNFQKPLIGKIHLAPQMASSSSFSKKPTKGLRKYLTAAAFAVFLSVFMPFSNVFAGNPNVIQGEKHGHKIEMAEDGMNYIVVDGKWQENSDPAKYTYSGMAQDVLVHAEDLGLDVKVGTKIYYDFIERMAEINGANSPDYTVYPGDTIYIPREINQISPQKAQSIAQEVSAKYGKSNEVSYDHSQSQYAQGNFQDGGNQTSYESQGGGYGPEGNGSLQGNLDRKPIYGGDPGDDDDFEPDPDDDQESFENSEVYQKFLVQNQDLIKRIDSLQAHIDDLEKTIVEIENLNSTEDDQLIAELQSQLNELKKEERKISFSFERKWETEFKVKDDESYWVGKGGDIKLKAYIANTGLGDITLTGKLKQNGSLRYGLSDQKMDLQRQLTIHVDNVFGQPYWIAGQLNWDNKMNPYGLGVGVQSFKFGGNKQFSLTPSLWYYSADVVKEIQGEGVRVTARAQQPSYLPTGVLDWKFSNGASLSWMSEGYFTSGMYTDGELSDIQHTLKYKNKGWDLRLIRGHQNPSIIKDLTRLSQEPGPYRAYVGKTWKVNGQKIGVSGYWAFDDHFKTQGGKIYVNLSGPLNYDSWKAGQSNSDKYSGIAFSSTVDIVQTGNTFFETGSPTGAVGDVAVGGNIGNLYVGFTGDYAASGGDLGSMKGYFTNPALELEYTLPLDGAVDNIHAGVRNGQLRAGVTFLDLDISSDGRFNIEQLNVNAWSLSDSDSSSTKRLIPEFNAVATYALSDKVFLQAEPTAIYSQDKLHLAGALSLMYKNYGIEGAKTFGPDNYSAYSMGYLPYPYDFRIGPVINFHNTSFGAYYSKDHSGQDFFGARVKVNINTRDGRSKKGEKRYKPGNGEPIDAFKKQKKDNRRDKIESASSSLLSRENLFGESQLSLWKEFKSKINEPYLFYISAAGSKNAVFQEVKDRISDLVKDHKNQAVYICLKVEVSGGVRHVATVDYLSVFEKNNYENLKDLLSGAETMQNKHMFFVELTHANTINNSSIILGNFYLSSQEENKLQKNGFGTQVFNNFAGIIKKEIPNCVIQTFDTSENLWTTRRFEENFDRVFLSDSYLLAGITRNPQINARDIKIESIENLAIESFKKSRVSSVLDEKYKEFPMHTLKKQKFNEEPDVMNKSDVDDIIKQYMIEIRKPENFKDLAFLFEDWLPEEDFLKKHSFLYNFVPWRNRLGITKWSEQIADVIYQRFLEAFNREQDELSVIYDGKNGNRVKRQELRKKNADQVALAHNIEVEVEVAGAPESKIQGNMPKKDLGEISKSRVNEIVSDDNLQTYGLSFVSENQSGKNKTEKRIDHKGREYFVQTLIRLADIEKYLEKGTQGGMQYLTPGPWFKILNSSTMKTASGFLIGIETQREEGDKKLQGFAYVKRIALGVKDGKVNFSSSSKKKVYILELLGDRELLDQSETWSETVLAELIRINSEDKDIQKDAKGIIFIYTGSLSDKSTKIDMLQTFLKSQGFIDLDLTGLPSDFASRVRPRSPFQLSKDAAERFYRGHKPRVSSSAIKGGIDLRNANYLSTQSTSTPILRVPQNEQFINLYNAQGFVPIIINIAPLINFNLYSFLNFSSIIQLATR